MKHPKPWKVHKETLPDAMTELGLVWDILDAADMWVASFKTEATALEIVRCVNAHEALVGANSQDPHPYSIGEIDGKWRVLLHGKDAGLLPCTDRSLAVIASQFANSGYSQALALAKEAT